MEAMNDVVGDVVGTATKTRAEVIEDVVMEWQRMAEVLLKPEEKERREKRDRILSEIDAMDEQMEILANQYVAAVTDRNCDLADALMAELRQLYHELDNAYSRIYALRQPVSLTTEQKAKRLEIEERSKRRRESVTPAEWAAYEAEEEEWAENEYFRFFPICVRRTHNVSKVTVPTTG